jgi:hypothetical protein
VLDASAVVDVSNRAWSVTAGFASGCGAALARNECRRSLATANLRLSPAVPLSNPEYLGNLSFELKGPSDRPRPELPASERGGRACPTSSLERRPSAHVFSWWPRTTVSRAIAASDAFCAIGQRSHFGAVAQRLGFVAHRSSRGAPKLEPRHGPRSGQGCLIGTHRIRGGVTDRWSERAPAGDNRPPVGLACMVMQALPASDILIWLPCGRLRSPGSASAHGFADDGSLMRRLLTRAHHRWVVPSGPASVTVSAPLGPMLHR